MAHSTLRRGKLRVADPDLCTTRLVGAGWTWECDCGEKGSWHATRHEAMDGARLHRLYRHGQR